MSQNVIDDGQIQLPFQVDNRPEELHKVGCEPPGCPLMAGEKEWLDVAIVCEFGTNKYRSMPEHMLKWDRAFELCCMWVQQREG